MRYQRPNWGISIHALLAESDETSNSLAHAPPQISIHALLAESDSRSDTATAFPLSFLSTLSLRRATRSNQSIISQTDDFYPRSPCGERRVHYDNYNLHCVISIHALLAESDGIGLVFMWWGVRFLSTLSLRRATGDECCKGSNNRDFYPRSPCGERLINAR